MSEQMKNVFEWGFKLLMVVIFPSLFYIFTLNTDAKLLEQTVKVQEVRLTKIEEKVEKIEKDLNQVQLNSLELKQMREDIKDQNDMMKEIYNWVLRQQKGK